MQWDQGTHLGDRDNLTAAGEHDGTPPSSSTHRSQSYFAAQRLADLLKVTGSDGFFGSRYDLLGRAWTVLCRFCAGWATRSHPARSGWHPREHELHSLWLGLLAEAPYTSCRSVEVARHTVAHPGSDCAVAPVLV